MTTASLQVEFDPGGVDKSGLVRVTTVVGLNDCRLDALNVDNPKPTGMTPATVDRSVLSRASGRR